MIKLTLKEELAIYSLGLEPHSRYKGHVICREGNHSWSVLEPNGNVHHDLNSLLVARAWVNAVEDYE